MSITKQQVIAICVQKIQERIATAEDAMKRAQESANGEEKSSAGDKYETSRAMGQLDRDMNARQLAEAKKELAALQKIDADIVHQTVANGSLVITSAQAYFIGVGLGIIHSDGISFIALSPNAPLSKMMIGKKVNDTVQLNSNKILIQQIG